MEETFTYDNYVQDPTSQQGFNRYAYCGYNPLKYTDPTGERRIGPSYAELMYLAEQEARNNAWNEIGRTVEDIGVKNANSINMSFCITWGEKNGCGDNHDNSGTGNAYDVPETTEGQTPEQEGDGKQTNDGNNTETSQSSAKEFYNNTEVHGGVVTTYTLFEVMINNTDDGKALIEEFGGFAKVAKFLKYGGGACGIISEGMDYVDFYNGDITFGEFVAKTLINVVEVAGPAIPVVGVPLSIILTGLDASGAIDYWFFKD